MSTLIPIREPGATAAAGPSWRAFLELGFRPLYLAGASWALVSVLIWIFAPHWAGGELAGLPWHAHEMLVGAFGGIQELVAALTRYRVWDAWRFFISAVIIGILVAKALHEVNDRSDYDGVVTFSVSKVEHED